MKKFTVIYDYGFMTYVDVVKAFTKIGARLKSRGLCLDGAKLKNVIILNGGIAETTKKTLPL
jgi:hypothetical protein